MFLLLFLYIFLKIHIIEAAKLLPYFFPKIMHSMFNFHVHVRTCACNCRQVSFSLSIVLGYVTEEKLQVVQFGTICFYSLQHNR